MRLIQSFLLVALALAHSTVTAPVETTGVTVLGDTNKSPNKHPKTCDSAKTFQAPAWNFTKSELKQWDELEKCKSNQKLGTPEVQHFRWLYSFALARKEKYRTELYKDTQQLKKATTDEEKKRLRNKIQEDKDLSADWSIKASSYEEKLNATGPKASGAGAV